MQDAGGASAPAEAAPAGAKPAREAAAGAAPNGGAAGAAEGAEGSGKGGREAKDPANPEASTPPSAPQPPVGDGEAPDPGNPKASTPPSAPQPPVRDGERVLVCLKRALKTAHAAQQQLAAALRGADTAPASLFVEILNHYLFYFDQGMPGITPSVLQARRVLTVRVLTVSGSLQ